MKDIIKNIIEGIVAIIAIFSSIIFVLGTIIVVFSPVWFPFIIILFIIKHW